MSDRLVIIDGYNVILRSPQLKPGDGRTLEQSRDKLVNLLSWMMGGESVRYLVVFDGDRAHGSDERGGRVEVRFSSPPEKADDVIRRIVEQRVGGDEDIVVVTGDIEVARHARAMGAQVSLSDLFLASALGAAKDSEGEPEKPATLTKAEIEEWAQLFRAQRPGEKDA